MGKSMFTLFIMGTILDDVTQATNAIRESGNAWMLLAFIVFILISSFMMLNMLIGVLVEVVAATAECEGAKRIEANVRAAIAQIFEHMDKDQNQKISREEFLEMRNHKKVMTALSDLDIERHHFKLYAELFFKQEELQQEERQESKSEAPTLQLQDGQAEAAQAVAIDGDTSEKEGHEEPETDDRSSSLSYEKLCSLIVRLRPGSFVSALDFAAFSRAINKVHDRIQERILKVERLAHEVAGFPPLEIEGQGTRA